MVRLRRVAYFKAQALIGSHVDSQFDRFVKMEQDSPEGLERHRAEKLNSLLRHAVNQVPFYRVRVVSRGVPHLDDFPVVTKTDLRNAYKDFMTPALRQVYERGNKRRWVYDWTQVKTGGTTGMPITVVHDASFRDEGRAARLYSQALCGFPFGTPYVRLWGSMRDVNEMRDSWPQRVTRFLAHEKLLNAFHMTRDRMNAYLELLNRLRPRHIMGYMDALFELARHAERTGHAVPSVVSIMTCAGTLTDDVRETLQRVFRARIHNKYGSRECGDMACECEGGSLHVYSHHVHLEVVDEKGRACPPTQRGRILVTLLGNLSFPMVRYEIGDIGAWRQGGCACGRPFPVLDCVEGRTGEFLRSVRGETVSPLYVRHLLGVVHNPGLIRRFQLVQEATSTFLLRVEIEPGHSWLEFERDLRAPIVRDLEVVLGPEAVITVEEVQRWNQGSGKHLYTENRAAHFS